MPLERAAVFQVLYQDKRIVTGMNFVASSGFIISCQGSPSGGMGNANCPGVCYLRGTQTTSNLHAPVLPFKSNTDRDKWIAALKDALAEFSEKWEGFIYAEPVEPECAATREFLVEV